MEKAQLDLDAPLLSARRHQSPTNSSELVNRRLVCDNEVTKPAAVPFLWEQTPGRPKNDHSYTPDECSNTPRLPPGRISDASRGETPKLRVSGSFGNMMRPEVESFSFSDHASLLEKLNKSLRISDESDSEALSFSEESSSFNRSQSSDVKPSGTFCIDAQTRDLLMSRFLPAAKAVVLEIPPNIAKKQIQLKPGSISGEMKTSVEQYCCRYVENIESEEESKSRDTFKRSGKAWGVIPRGMLPRFCVKNSLSLLSPEPMKTSTRRRLSRNAHSGPLDKIPSQVIQTKRFSSGLLSRDLKHVDDDRSRVSPLRRYRSRSISPYRNEPSNPAFREAESFNASKIALSRKMFKALQDVSRNRGRLDDPMEKTLTPPLPKSPTESWLWITLGNPFANSRRSSPIRSANTKWETIVKTSNYSQELVPRSSVRQTNRSK